MPTSRSRAGKAAAARTRGRRGNGRGPHRHSRAHCLQVLKRLSDYLDDELPSTVCREIRKHMGACPRCEIFLGSLRDTITLCRHSPAKPLSPSARAKLRKEILRLAGAA